MKEVKIEFPIYRASDLTTANSRIKSILFMNKEKAKEFPGYKNAVCSMIHIQDCEDKEFLFNDNMKDQLWEVFDDYDYCDCMYATKACHKILEGNAVNIANFVEAIKNYVDVLIIHCDGGVSRSPSIAVALSVYLGLNTKDIWNCGNFCPNHLVFDTMCKALNIPDIRKEVEWNTGMEINNIAWEESHKE